MSDLALTSTALAMLAVITIHPLCLGANALLKRKYVSMSKAWAAKLEKCKAESLTTMESSWLARQKSAVIGGKLCAERAYALKEAGFITTIANADALPDIASEQKRFSFEPSAIQRLAYLSAALALPLGIAVHGASPAQVWVGCALSLLLTLITICDLRARIIPYQCCIAFGIASILWVALFRPSAIASSAIIAVISYLVICATEKGAVSLTSASAIGAGDRRLIPFICFLVGLQGLLPGLIALSVAAGAMAVCALARGKSRRSYLPFAPALMAFAVVGVIYPFTPLAGVLI